MDVGTFIDERPVTPFQYAVVILCALVAVLDGIDTLSIGIAAKAMTRAYHVTPADFGPIFGAALFGALLGALSFGALGDYFGRKRTLVGATLCFALFTALTPLAPSLHVLQAIRFLAGVGLGGATPCFVALTAEYAPKRSRSMFVTIQYAAFPLGGVIGGFLSSSLLIHFGWPSIFYVGSLLPLILSLVLMGALPESLRYLVTKNPGDPAIKTIVRKIDPRFDPAIRLVSNEVKLPGQPTRHLFTEGRAANTLLIWAALFTSFAVLIFVPLWTPLILGRVGVSIASASLILSLNTFGAVIGMSLCGYLLVRLGPSRVLLTAFAAGALSTALMGVCADVYPLLMLTSVLGGVGLAIGASGAIVLASELYPTSIRSTGLGWGFSMAKLGQVLVPMAGGVMIAREWTAVQIFAALGVIAAVGFVAVLALRFRAATPAVEDMPDPVSHAL